jgi:hypothetical protein
MTHRSSQNLAVLLWCLSALALAFLLAGCVTDSQGNSRFDAATFGEVTRTSLDAYDRLQGNRPVYPAGAPYPVYPVGY